MISNSQKSLARLKTGQPSALQFRPMPKVLDHVKSNGLMSGLEKFDAEQEEWLRDFLNHLGSNFQPKQ